jgi:hypothetical protein
MVNKPPIDTMYLTQHLERNKPHEAGEIKSGWTPQCFEIKNILNFRTASIEKMKNFYCVKYIVSIGGLFTSTYT